MFDPTEYTPLWSLAYEQQALGAMILSEHAAREIEGILDSEHFYREAHRLVFDAVTDILAVGSPLEYTAIVESLKMRRIDAGHTALEAVGGDNYLLHLCEACENPTSSRFYAGQILDRYIRREMAAIGKAAALGEVSIDELRLRMERLNAAKARSTPARSGHISEFGKRGRPKGVPTGFAFIDKPTTMRGLPKGQLSVVMADTGGGKTAWAIRVAINAARKGYRVCFATFADLDGDDIKDRMTKNLCGWAVEPTPGTPDHEQWCKARAEIDKLPIDIFDVTDLYTGREVETFAEWFKTRLTRVPYDLLIVDYAQELVSRDKKAKTLFDQAQVCAHVLRWLAKATGVAILVGSQITEGNAKSGTKDITMGSRVWQQRAALVLKLSVLTDEDRTARKDVSDLLKAVTGLTEAHLQKNRFGAKNLKAWWRWQTEYADFTELGS